jgi:anti-sigma-K factor RskA
VSEHRDEHIELCAGYSLGSLDEADRERLELHLAGGCEPCEAALAELSAATVLLAAAAPPARPSAALRARVLSALGAPVPPEEEEEVRIAPPGRVIELKPRRRSLVWAAWIPATAAAAFAVTSVVLWKQVGRLEEELVTRQRLVADLSSRLAEEQRLNEVLSAPGAKVAVLEITPQGEQALRARATYDPATRRAVVIVENLRAPSGHDYQLWAIRGATPASLGVIKTDESGRAVLRLEDVGDPTTLNAFAISLEPAGGSPNPSAPTGPVVMLGKLGG